MSHYNEQREADEIWSKAPEGAVDVRRGAQGGMFFTNGVDSFYDAAAETWLSMVFSKHDWPIVHARPICSTKTHQNAQDELKQPDPVNHPKHYAIAPGVEAIDIIKASLTPEQFEGYLLGNFLKYRLRAGDKGDLRQDIAKSNWYRERLNEN